MAGVDVVSRSNGVPNEALGAEHLGPSGKRQRLGVLRGQEVQPGEVEVTTHCPGRCPDGS
jgi:hypothetical protein